ncbi:MAG: hypothetical protein IKL55_00735 [Clostridia bacterium]|nr:hypothetical protein [Clostridia bacterium]
MEDLIDNLKENATLVIRNAEYKVKTKTWYSLEEDEDASYIKCELSNNKVLVVIPDDELIYIGEAFENLNYERISENQIKYDNIIFTKTGDGHQVIKNIEFGLLEEVEGKCVFEDYESENNIISLGILTDKNNKVADVLADILDLEEIQIKQ